MEKAHLNLIKWGLEEGYSVEVYGEEEYLDYAGGNYDEAVEAVEACDGGMILMVILLHALDMYSIGIRNLKKS